MLERYENLRHEGPDYSYFLQVEMKEKFYDAMLDWLEKEAYLVIENVGIFCDIVESFKRDKVIIYACKIKNKEDEETLKGYAMLNAMKFDNLRDMDTALNYLIKFVRLLEEEYIYNYCEILCESEKNIIEEEEFEIIPKKLDEIFDIVSRI